MQVILVILFWVVVIFVGVKYSKWKKENASTKNRTGKYSVEYAKERDLTGHTWAFITSAKPEQVIGIIGDYIEKSQFELGGLHKFRVAERGDSKIIITFGFKGIPGFTAVLAFASGQTTAAYTIINWLQSDGVSTVTKQMEILLSVVKGAFTSLDSETRIEKISSKA